MDTLLLTWPILTRLSVTSLGNAHEIIRQLEAQKSGLGQPCLASLLQVRNPEKWSSSIEVTEQWKVINVTYDASQRRALIIYLFSSYMLLEFLMKYGHWCCLIDLQVKIPFNLGSAFDLSQWDSCTFDTQLINMYIRSSTAQHEILVYHEIFTCGHFKLCQNGMGPGDPWIGTVMTMTESHNVQRRNSPSSPIWHLHRDVQ